MSKPNHATGWIALLLGLLLVQAGCSQSKIAGNGRAGDAPDRIPALVRQADPLNASGQDGINTLIHALDDDDPAVRLFAVQALRERTGQSFGYRYYDSADRRRPAVRRWRDWADAQDDPGTPSPGTPGTPAPGTGPNPNTASASPAH
ncbi:HEAT repeat domain-containing protein [Phycisphaeraceae bacterium D3-23]